MDFKFDNTDIPEDIRKQMEESMRKAIEQMGNPNSMESSDDLEFYERDAEEIAERRERLLSNTAKQEISLEDYEVYRGEAFNEILSNEPGGIIRYGVSILFGIVVLLIIGTAFVKYPEIVRTTGKLFGGGYPTSIIAQNNGKLVDIYVKEGQNVEEGQDLGLLENTSASNQIIELDRLVNNIYYKIVNKQSIQISYESFYKFNNLGELQDAYQQFMNGLVQNSYFQNDQSLANNRQAINEEMSSIQEQIRQIGTQLEIANKDLTLTEEAYLRTKAMYEKGYVSKAELEVEEGKVLAKRSSISQMRSSLSNLKANSSAKNKGMQDIGVKYRAEEKSFAQGILTLKSNIEKWKKKYMLVAPVSGKVSFVGPLAKNKEIKQGDPVFSITTPGDTMFILTILPQANLGKVKLNQKVNIKFQAYPHLEYGIVNGTLSYISSQPSDSGYYARIILPYGMQTMSGDKLEFKHGLISENEIITEDMSLLKRLYIKLIKKVGRN